MPFGTVTYFGDHAMTYDDLGRVRTYTLTSDEHTMGGEGGGTPFERQWLANFSDSYDQAGNVLMRGETRRSGGLTAQTDLGRYASAGR